MLPEPYEYTVVIKNNIPEFYSATSMADEFGYTPFFFRDHKGLKIQWQLFYSILEGKSGTKLFEFKTATTFIISNDTEEEQLYDIVYAHLLTAINGFNWHFERNKSYLTMGKQYPSPTNTKEVKHLVEEAYLNHSAEKNSI